MSITNYLNKYKKLGYLFDPEYERDNEVLSAFKSEYPVIDVSKALQLKQLLLDTNEWADKFFVADLLYLYKSFDKLLLVPLLNCAIQLPDPSINRIFLHPCINSFGLPTVCTVLTEKFKEGDLLQRIRVAGLLYWIRPEKKGEADELYNAVLQQAANTDNLVELYHYGLKFGTGMKPGTEIPADALELMNAIKGHADYEDLLFRQLNWQRIGG